MTDYKLVPVEMALPCPFCGSSNIGNKYIEAYSTDSSYDTFGCKDCGARFEDGCQDDWNRRAAPAVQGEPVAWMHDSPERVDVIHSAVKKLLIDSHDAAGHLHRPLDRSEHYTIPLYAAPQPAPDVAGLVEALEEIENPIKAMRDRLQDGEHLDGFAAVQLAGDAEYLRSIAREALTALRKQQGG